jgi:hypothetical protein
MQDMRFARLADGQEIAYREWSNNAGPAILHTHGATAPLELLGEDPMYDRFLRTLDPRLDVVARPCYIRSHVHHDRPTRR